MKDTINQIRSTELQRFSENASHLLLTQDRLVQFFQSLDYELEPHGGGFRGVCPACQRSFCYVGVNGTHHKVFWKCYDRQCDSNKGKSGLCRNLLGLVKGLVEEQHLGTAIETIAEFLGYQGRSWDITNGKFRTEKAGPPPEDERDPPPF
jgi:hypothetical protein